MMTAATNTAANSIGIAAFDMILVTTFAPRTYINVPGIMQRIDHKKYFEKRIFVKPNP